MPSETRSMDMLIHQPQPQQNPSHPQEILLDFRSGLRVTTQDLDSHRSRTHPKFAFAPNSETNVFPTPSAALLDDDFSPSFMLPAATAGPSGSNYLFVSPARMGDFDRSTRNLLQGSGFGSGSGTELAEMISAAGTSTTTTTTSASSRTVGLDNPFGQLEFDPNFTFDNPGYFP